MQDGIMEIRWHGRGGQGAKTAALLFADAALEAGKHIQAFPEYGPERMGAPVSAYDRLSDEPITLHCGITEPQIVIVLDPTLIGKIDVTAGLPDDGMILINTDEDPREVRKRLKLTGRRIFTVDASRISRETIGKEIPNTPMLGALIRVSGLLDLEEMLAGTRAKLEKKFAAKPEVVEGNLVSIRRAYEEVKSE